MKIKKRINIEQTEKAMQLAQVSDALAHPLRVALLNYVAEQKLLRNDICNKDLVAHFPYSQSTLSQHIKKLKIAKLINVEYEDKFSFYSVNRDTLDFFITSLKEI